MSWEERLLAVFDDLEQQAEGMALLERDAEVAELSRAAYAGVDLTSRLHAAPGRAVRLGMLGVGALSGTVVRVGSDFLLLEGGGVTWVVRTAALVTVSGLSDSAVGTHDRALPARVGLGSMLRGFAEAAVPLSVHLVDGEVVVGRVRKVGADFVELWADGARGAARPPVVLVPFSAVGGLRLAAGA